jgi:hypothetical protein
MKKTVHTGPAERPILFQTEMVKAILEGRKTQTRRTRGLDEINQIANEVDFHEVYQLDGKYQLALFSDDEEGHVVKSPYGKPGDLLWVRETWQESTFLAKDDPDYGYIYRASGNGMAWEQGDDTWRWKPSIHMPKEASRIWLMIEDIRVERLWDITEADAKAEGVEYIESDNFFQKGWKNYNLTDLDDPNFHTALLSFESLWLKIKGEESFQSNPWLWVIQFRVLSTTGKPSEEHIQQNLSALASLREKKEEVVNG